MTTHVAWTGSLRAYDITLPCLTPSAEARHRARNEKCALCGVVGSKPAPERRAA